MVVMAKDNYQAVMMKVFIELITMAENVKIAISFSYIEEMDMHNRDTLWRTF